MKLNKTNENKWFCEISKPSKGRRDMKHLEQRYSSRVIARCKEHRESHVVQGHEKKACLMVGDSRKRSNVFAEQVYQRALAPANACPEVNLDSALCY